MYSWSEDTSGWYGSASYSYDPARAAARVAEAKRADASGPRTYNVRTPNLQLVDPKKKISSTSKNPLLICIDVTGSMQTWPAEIFDRLPLLYNTLSQYRSDLEVSFAAIGDASSDQWPLQVTPFGKGYDLEKFLQGIYGEGRGGDEPEDYGLFAWFVNRHVSVPNAERPFLIVFGDAAMHAKIGRHKIQNVLGGGAQEDADAVKTWQEVAKTWNVWFLRRPGGRDGDFIHRQWGEAVGSQRAIHIHDEPRAVDYAMGLIARSWGHFGDFKQNMRARQDEGRVLDLAARIPRALTCPKCNAKIPPEAAERFTCSYCGVTVEI